MAFVGAAKKTAEYGDWAIVYTNPQDMKPILLKEGENYISKHGKFPHTSLVNQPFGRKIPSHTNMGFIYLLHPTPELWTRVLAHRTQILYMPDISFCSAMLELGPGSCMIEAGTGSGSFTHSISRSIGKEGCLYTYEYHAERQAQAAKEFLDHGLTNVISKHADVCKDGFDVTEKITSMFLDLPSPWEAINHPTFKPTFQKDRVGRLICFSPCMEQVLLTVSAMKEQGFTSIKMHECLMRTHQVAMIEPLQGVPQKKEEKGQNKERGEKRKRKVEGGITVSKIEKTVRGHTSFLTYGELLPQEAAQE